MMKYLKISLVVSIFFLAFSLHGQNVDISIDHPDRVNAGEDFTLSVTIKKGTLRDYSRFSQDLPLGLTASNLSSPNADFSFDDQRVRIIWLKLPEANEIKLSYLVSVDSRLKGSFSLGGVFAYVVDDERKFLNLTADRMITIVPSSTVDPAQITDIKDFKGGAAVAPAGVATTTEMFAMAVRQKPVLMDNGGYQIHLLMNNPVGSKYAKIEETIPSGYLFEEVSSSEGIVSHAASTVKFIWMKLPEQPEIEVVYRLVPKQNEPQGKMQIEGLFTYTAGNENKVVVVKEVDNSLGNLSSSQKRSLLTSGTVSGAVAVTPPQETRTPPPQETRTTPPPATGQSAATGGTASDRIIVNTKVLDSGSGSYFRVQLAANRNAFDATTYFRQAGVDREVLVEQHQGLFKYTVGPFQTHEQALSYRQRVESIPEAYGAFVVGYRNGKRVSASSLR